MISVGYFKDVYLLSYNNYPQELASEPTLRTVDPKYQLAVIGMPWAFQMTTPPIESICSDWNLYGSYDKEVGSESTMLS